MSCIILTVCATTIAQSVEIKWDIPACTVDYQIWFYFACYFCILDYRSSKIQNCIGTSWPHTQLNSDDSEIFLPFPS